MEDRILRKIKNKSLTIDELSVLLGEFSSVDFIELVKCVNKLIDDKKIFEIDGRLYSNDIYSYGKVIKQKRFCFIDGDKPLDIINHDDFNLNDGDEIIYKVNNINAVCVKVIKRAPVYVLGTYVNRHRSLYFFSDDYKYANFTITNFKDYKNQIKNNYRVRTVVLDFKKKTLKIDKVLGDINDESTLIDTILLMNNAPGDFNNKVKEEIKGIDSTVSIANRKDLRSLNFITIDGKDAKDFDDAIYVERKDNGYLLYVSIADVSHYVKKNSELDKEAISRGTSIYYPGKVIPMLPHILCDDLCSLKEGVDRYTLTCQMEIDFEGSVVSYDIYPSVINSKHRTTYDEINKVLEHDKQLLEKYNDITQMIYAAYELSRIVDKQRKSKGGIEFESNEPIIIDENGKVVDIKLRTQGKAEILIEDFMILANETVATHMFYLGYPLIYRNHDYPKKEKIIKFVQMVNDLGYTFKGNKYELDSASLQRCLNSFEGKAEFSIVSDTLLRSMAKAIYESSSNGHYGLGLDHYCHFTSPIRRYPDLVVHRMLKKYVFKADLNEIDEDNHSNKELAKSSNTCEKRAVQIERNILDLKRCEYMEDKVGDSFEAVISSVLNFGFYVELENTVEGLVSINTLNDDFEYIEQEDIITDGKTTYKLGQKVKVICTRVDKLSRKIDFELYKKYSRKDYLAY